MAEKKTTTREAYCKPQMEQVELVPEEAVLATCKYNTGSGNQYLCEPGVLTCISTQRS
jgi:hypothetical protein